MRSSLQLDIAAGRPSELDAIGGALIRRGQKHELPTPAIAKMVATLQGSDPLESRQG
ncbi:ketopantoate reductase [Arthrobacter sp. CAN_A6]